MRSAPVITLVAGLCLLGVLAASIASGSVWLTPSQVLHVFGPNPEDLARLIVLELRLPRAVLGLAIGGTLGLCGAVLQGLLRNPLADPALLGVSSGAALGAVIALYFGLSAEFAYAAPVLGLVGATGAAMLTFLFGRGGTLSLILAGAAVSGLCGAGLSLALNLAPNPSGAYEIMTWLMGSLTDSSWDHVKLAAPFIIVGSVILASTARSLDALSLGEAQAESLGIDLDRLRLTILIGVALCVGGATSVAGAIGFVGLISPHLVRPFVGHQPSRTLLPSALFGAALLLGADVGSRLLRYHGAEIKLGVFTALVGTPFFFWLVVRLRRTAP
jgi:iron complex transport system permease protein